MRRTRILLVVLTMAFIGLAWTAAAQAEGSFRTGNDVTVSEGQALDSSLFASGHTIDIAGSVDGDVFCVGQDVNITGNVTGDVICAGQTVHVSGTVGGNIRVVGQTVTVGGATARSLSAAGQNVTLDSAGTVRGDTSLAGQNVTLNGAVARDLAAGGNSVMINGTVGRDVTATVADLTLGSSAHIGGNLVYISHNDVSRAGGAVVAGTTTRTEPAAGQGMGDRFSTLLGGSFLFALYMFVAFLVVALALVLLLPQLVHDAAEAAVRSPWKALLVGVLSSFVVPAIIGALMFTLIGIPVAILLLLAWIVIVCVAVPFTAYYLGLLLLGKNPASPIWTMLLGMAIILVLYLIPIVGFIMWLAATWFGLGIILLQFPRLPRPHYTPRPAKS